MASHSATENLAIARAYPFGQFSRLVDVGGAHGHLLATILRRNRKLRGVLFDRPAVVATSAESAFITARGIRERVKPSGVIVPVGAGGVRRIPDEVRHSRFRR